MINAFFAPANMSQFGYVSPICGIGEQFKSPVLDRRATKNHERLFGHRALCDSRLRKPAGCTQAKKQNDETKENRRKGPVDGVLSTAWRYG